MPQLDADAVCWREPRIRADCSRVHDHASHPSIAQHTSRDLDRPTFRSTALTSVRELLAVFHPISELINALPIPVRCVCQNQQITSCNSNPACISPRTLRTLACLHWGQGIEGRRLPNTGLDIGNGSLRPSFGLPLPVSLCLWRNQTRPLNLTHLSDQHERAARPRTAPCTLSLLPEHPGPSVAIQPVDGPRSFSCH